MEKVLLVADHAAQQLCGQRLAPGGFYLEAVAQGEAGLERALTGEYVALLLAAGLPELSAFDLLRRLRAKSRLPVLLLVEPDNEEDGILGLELGADDYLLQPVNPRALVARLRAVLRRVRYEAFSPLPPPLLTSGELALDELTRTVWRGGEKLALTTVEFDLLRAFLRAPGRALTREELAQNVLGRSFHPADRSLDVHISNLRKKLGRADYLKALRSIGYVFAAPSELA